jgi:hypothetical protein
MEYLAAPSTPFPGGEMDQKTTGAIFLVGGIIAALFGVNHLNSWQSQIGAMFGAVDSVG